MQTRKRRQDDDDDKEMHGAKESILITQIQKVPSESKSHSIWLSYAALRSLVFSVYPLPEASGNVNTDDNGSEN